MYRKHSFFGKGLFVLSSLVLVLSILFSFTSCEEPPVVESVLKTPTIRGTLSIPESAGVKPENVWVKVVSDGDTNKIIKAKEDYTFSIDGLEEGKPYDITFSTIEPDHNNFGTRSLESSARGIEETDGFGGWIGGVIAVPDGKDVGSVKMKPLGTISGKACFRGEDEHYGIDVYIPGTSYIAKTDGAGNYSIFNVPEGTYTIRFEYPSYLSVMKEDVKLVVVDDTKHPEFKVDDVSIIKAVGTVKGSVILAGVDDHQGTLVRLEGANADGDEFTTTLSDGSYSIPNVAPGTYSIVLSHDGYVFDKIENVVVNAADTTFIEETFLAKKTAAIKGYVELGGSGSFEGVNILAKRTDGKTYNTITSADGEYVITGILPGTYTIYASKEGYESFTVEDVTLTSSSLKVLDKQIMKVSQRSVVGTVVLDSRTDATGVLITATNIQDTKLVYDALTNRDGRFSLMGMKPGEYVLDIVLDGYTCEAIPSVDVKVDTLVDLGEINLTRITGDVVGKVSYGSAAPFRTTVVLDSVRGTEPQRIVFTDADGNFKFTDCNVGAYELTITADGYFPIHINDVKVAAGKVAVYDSVMEASIGSLSGTVRLSDVSSYSGIIINISNEKLGFSDTASTDVNGNYRFRDIAPGLYDVSFSKTGYASHNEQILVVAGKDNKLYADLVKSQGIITGKVSLSDTHDFSGVTVSAVEVGGKNAKYTVNTAKDGTFNIPNIVDEGDYQLEISMQGYASDLSQVVNVKFGAVAKMNPVELLNISVTVKGRIELDGAKSFEGVNIYLVSEDGMVSYPSSTTQDGEYIINDVAPGEYTLIVSKLGYITKERTGFIVEQSKDKLVEDIVLHIGTRSVTGNITLEFEQDYSGILITATNLSNTSKVYSAITNAEGDFSLAEMEPGRYKITYSKNNYGTFTLSEVNIISDELTVLAPVQLLINKGSIVGVVLLEGRFDHSGTVVTLAETGETTVTDINGRYEFNLPSRNYPEGVKFEHEDFVTSFDTETITVMTGSAYSVPQSKLIANAVTVKGYVDVLGTNVEDNVTVSIIGTDMKTVTAEDGYFEFKHVPLTKNKYTLRFEKENAPAVTRDVKVEPSAGIEVETVFIIPDATSITGLANLNGMSDNSGILITAVSDDASQRPLETETDASGYFYLSNLLTNSTYTVTFSKPGWDSQSIHVDGLEPLVLKDVTGNKPIVLVDTTLPVLNGVAINNGAPSTSKLEVSISIDAFEEGSGIEDMKISWFENFDRSEWQPYQASFTTEIPDKLNGTKILKVMVRDAAGNVAVSVATADIVLSDQIRTIEGVLETEEDLHWTAKNNPYVVSGDIMVKEGARLVIDPGVDVLFNGNFSILMKGDIYAVGTPEKPIYFRSSKDALPDNMVGYDGYWGGININSEKLNVSRSGYDFTFESGSIFKNCVINDIHAGIAGYAFIDSCQITSDYRALTSFYGYLLNSDIHGDVIINRREMNGLYNIVFNNTLHYVEHSYDSDWRGNTVFVGVDLINNHISGYERIGLWSYHDASRKVRNNTFDGCKFNYDIYFNNAIFEFNEIINCNTTIKADDDAFKYMHFNNLYSNTATPLFEVTGDNTNNYDWRYNYWGAAYTNELDSLVAAGRGNASFIKDFYDNFNLGEADWAYYAHDPWKFAGYKGDAFMDVEIDYPRPAYEVPVGNSVYFRIKSFTNEISEYRVAMNLNELMAKDWIPYSVRGGIDSSEIDVSKVNERGYLELLIQGRDGNGSETPIVNLEVPYRAPIIYNVGVDENAVIEGDEQFYLGNKFNWSSPYGDINRTWTIDGVVCASEYVRPKELKNGEHVAGVQVIDHVGQSAYKEVSFEVKRPVPEVSLFKIEKDSLGLGESLVFDLDLVNTKHLKSLKVFANDNLLVQRSYTDEGKANVAEHGEVKAVYLPAGDNKLYVELEDYAGNINKVEVGSFDIVGVAAGPMISGLTIEDGTVFTGNETIDLGLTFEDEGGVRNIQIMLGEYRIFNATYNSYSSKLNCITPRIQRIELPMYKNGNYVLHIEAVDFSGERTVVERNIIIDRPLMYIDNVLEVLSDRYTMIGTVSNAEYLSYVNIYIDNTLVKTIFRPDGDVSDTFHYDFELLKDNLPSGRYSLSIEAYDIAGNSVKTLNDYKIEQYYPVENDYGLGKTWDEDGTLIEDSYTRLLLGFEDQNRLFKETVTGRVHMDGYSHWFDVEGVGNGGCKPSCSFSIMESIPLYDGIWTYEYWFKKDIGSREHCGIHIYDKNSRFFIQTYMSSYWNVNISSKDYNSQIVQDNWMNCYMTSYQNMAEWHHFALVSDGQDFLIYVDGILQGRFEDRISPDEDISQFFFELYEGNHIDEIRFSDKARSQQELFDYVQYVKKLKNW